MADAPGQLPVVVESIQTHTPLDPCAQALACAQEHGEELRLWRLTEHHLRRHVWRRSPDHVHVNWRAALGDVPAMSSETSWMKGTIPRSLLGLARTSPPRQCFCVAFLSLPTP